ncbi:MurR/RpiR family transcriptional regulator [uncultured Tyzzerella sp.]|uniref:MurR/RpiR family transcriptional regulator n=1 Tax=uncultured Tyzzerella sp. TaxID=2321398 RepID=UPI002942B786|nr:MurR/RpiR family transcriptional regulator [uncultured Tyzzerella sp.]
MFEDDLLKKINEKMLSLSKSQKRLASFILEHYDEAAFMTASRLGEVAGVSESTVVRFASEMGFDGYPKMQTELESLIKTKLTAAQRMRVSAEQISKSNKDVLTNILEKDAERIKCTLSTLDKNSFEHCVEKILKARKVYIIGVRSANSLSSFLAFYLNLMINNVIYVNSSTATEIFEQIFRIEEDDVLIGISFPRYSRRTIKAMEYAFSKNATTIAITDSKYSPLVNFATNSLIARSDMVSFIDSLVAPLSVINALLVAISVAKKDDMIITLENLENIWSEYQVYNYRPIRNFF